MVQELRKKFLKGKPLLALAPMAGISSQPFRLICKEFGADLLFSEMISSEAIYYNKLKMQKSKCKINESLYKTLKLIKFSQAERPFVVQIFGADPEHMAYAAEYIASGKWAKDYLKIVNCQLYADQRIADKLKIASIPDGIDINMGCPVKDITRQGAGAALIKNLPLAEKIVKSIKKKIKIPLSVKTRIGWRDNKNTLVFCRTLEQVGAEMITIHGRTYQQGFSGEVDWETIYKVKKSLKIPVVGNGGINENWKLEIGNFLCDGYMIGRGALGNPWIFQKIKNQNSKCKIKDYHIILAERKKVILQHAQLVHDLQGEQGIVEFRKQLTGYFKGLPESKKLRLKIPEIYTLDDVKKLLPYLPLDKN